MLIAASTIILLLLAYGIAQRKNSKVHIPVMLSAFVLDVALVLYIEITRHAVETFVDSVKTPVDHGFLLFHIGVSLLTLALYIAQIVTGRKLFKGNHGIRPLHRKLAWLFIVCRLTNYVTSF